MDLKDLAQCVQKRLACSRNASDSALQRQAIYFGIAALEANFKSGRASKQDAPQHAVGIGTGRGFALEAQTVRSAAPSAAATTLPEMPGRTLGASLSGSIGLSGSALSASLSASGSRSAPSIGIHCQAESTPKVGNEKELLRLGGAQKLKRQIVEFLASNECLDLEVSDIQDLWIDEMQSARARLSALFRICGSDADVRQFVLSLSHGSWEIVHALAPEGEGDDCEQSFAEPSLGTLHKYRRAPEVPFSPLSPLIEGSNEDRSHFHFGAQSPLFSPGMGAASRRLPLEQSRGRTLESKMITAAASPSSRMCPAVPRVAASYALPGVPPMPSSAPN